MAYVDDVADELADLAMAEADASGSDKIIDQIGEILGASSQSLHEGYLTGVRVRRAERRARAVLADHAAKRNAAAAAAASPST